MKLLLAGIAFLPAVVSCCLAVDANAQPADSTAQKKLDLLYGDYAAVKVCYDYNYVLPSTLREVQAEVQAEEKPMVAAGGDRDAAWKKQASKVQDREFRVYLQGAAGSIFCPQVVDMFWKRHPRMPPLMKKGF